MHQSLKIAVLISGGGTTLKNLIDRIEVGSLHAEIKLVVSSNAAAGGLKFASAANMDSKVISHRDFENRESFSSAIFDALRDSGVQLVVMGGFLRQLAIPDDFENRIINIHPSLIPSFCGKGNYGSRVHQGVLDYGCKLSGCTVHFVDDDYDHGPIIAQSPVPVLENDDAKSLAARVFEAECELLPTVINQIAQGLVSVADRKVTIGDRS